MDFNLTKFRCSSLKDLMTNPRSKSETISETAKKKLIEVYIKEMYGREKDISNKYIEKGLAVEQDAMILYRSVYGTDFKPNKDPNTGERIRLTNNFITGELDMFKGESIEKATEILDTKSSWDLFTFHNSMFSGQDEYYWQMQGYMALTGAENAKLVFCLIDTPPHLIYQAQNQLKYKMGIIDEDNPLYVEACDKLEKSMTYSDIPKEKRIFVFDIPRQDYAIEDIENKVVDCRNWIQKQFNTNQLTNTLLTRN